MMTQLKAPFWTLAEFVEQSKLNLTRSLNMIEKNEYKFPDEVDDVKVEVVLDGEEVDIEIEDDTPERDRNIDPLPDNLKEELYQDELTDYSAKVKKKILQMKKLAQDERRDKEQAKREQGEAITLAQRLIEENKRLKISLNDSENSVLKSVSRNVDMEMDKAKQAYKEAHESGDTDKMLEAQESLTEISIRSDKVKNFKVAPLQADDSPVQIQQPTIQSDPTAVSWKEDNTWFGEDEEMTSLALGLHEKLKKEGVRVSSKEYYKRIDDTMRKRFPENFETDIEEKEEKSKSSTRPSNVVASASRSTSSKKIRLTQSQMSIAKKLNITPEQYAQALIKMES